MNKNDPKLSEKDFIHEEYRKNPYPFWFWTILFSLLIMILLLGKVWFGQFLSQKDPDPFMQVTNRQMSLFLWQFPEHMRIHAKRKTGYLTAFQFLDKVNPEIELVEKKVVAPPELLFLYHTWDRLIREYGSKRPIYSKEFQEFLRDNEEWQPNNWPDSPKEYFHFVNVLHNLSPSENLQHYSELDFPIDIRLAFQGWKNYFKEGVEINRMEITYKKLQVFLQKYPHYAPNYWQNIYTPHFLNSFALDNFEEDQLVDNKELTSFLRVAFYNEAMRNEFLKTSY